MIIATYNVQHVNNYKSQVIDFDACANAIKSMNADVVGLNEIRGAGNDPDYTNQVERLASMLGMHCVFGMSAYIGNKGPYGNALLSKYPVMKSEVIPIPTPNGKEPRSVLRAQLSNGLVILQTHLGLTPDEHKTGVDIIHSLLVKEEKPCMLMGDFNVTPDNSVLSPLYNDERVVSTDGMLKGALTFPSIDPDRKIDYIFANRLVEFDSVFVPDITESDHRPIVATVNNLQ